MVTKTLEEIDNPTEKEKNPLTKEEIIKTLQQKIPKEGARFVELGLNNPYQDLVDELVLQLDGYEGPADIQQKLAEIKEAKVKKDVPVWLRENTELIYQGPKDNPYWETSINQYEDHGEQLVSVGYKRRNKLLYPGKQKPEQFRDLEPVDNTFTLSEYNVAKEVFEEFRKLVIRIDKGDEEAKKILKEIVSEEQHYRQGRPIIKKEKVNEEEIEKTHIKPQIIEKIVSGICNKLEKTKRGFKAEAINKEKLTQQVAEILSQLLVLNKERGDKGTHMLGVDPAIKEYPTFKLALENLAKAFAYQKETNKGVSLLMGEAGTGKNEAVKYFAAKTNRPFYWFPCGKGMEAMDLLQHYEFTTKEGLKKFYTDLADGIQTPGAVVMIDEVNALQPAVQAILHGLGDSSRSFKYDGIEIKVAPDVLIVMAGNPASYAAAGELGQALLDRSAGQTVRIDYPALTKSDFEAKTSLETEKQAGKEKKDNKKLEYALDEVLVLYPRVPEFANLSEKSFSNLWESIINEDDTAEVSNDESLKELISKDQIANTTKTLIDLRNILKVCDTWRKQDRDSVRIGVSLRGSTAITDAYIKVRDVRKTFLQHYNILLSQPIQDSADIYAQLKKWLDTELSN